MRIVFSLILGLFVSSICFAQYLPQNEMEQAVPDGYKKAKSTMVSGIVVGGISAAVWLTGNVICVVEQNKYTNGHTTSGSIEEVYKLNQEAKQQPGYKRGQIMELAGFAGLIIGGGIAWIGGSKMKKIRNSSGQEIALLSYGTRASGIGVSLLF